MMRQYTWVFVGQSCVGMLVGLITGLSVSPVVNTLIGLVFAFAGGSIVVLVRGRDPKELSLMAKALTALTISMIIGVAIGAALRGTDPLGTHSPKRPFALDKPLAVNEIIVLTQKKVPPETIRMLLSAHSGEKQPRLITVSDVTTLLENDVHPGVLDAMLSPLVPAPRTTDAASGQGLSLHERPSQPDSSTRDLEAIKLGREIKQ